MWAAVRYHCPAYLHVPVADPTENETELSLFNRKDYDEFKKDPEIKWD